MKVYSIRQVQFIPADMATVWDFFSTPANLEKITPTSMNFVTLHITGGPKMYAGQLISYKVSPFPFMRIRWTTEIKNVVNQKYFADEQKLGPFVLWYHQHFFEEKNGGVEMTDEVCYAVPLGWFGRLANILFVEAQVKAILQFRKDALDKLFPSKSRSVPLK